MSEREEHTITGGIDHFPQEEQTITGGIDNFSQEGQTLTGGIEYRQAAQTVTQFQIEQADDADSLVRWEIGDVIDGKYEVLGILGQGAMGIVYKVHHREWNLDLAVKMPLFHLVANDALKARFVVEAQTRVNVGLHPNIVQCWYVRDLDGIPRVFMDYLDECLRTFKGHSSTVTTLAMTPDGECALSGSADASMRL